MQMVKMKILLDAQKNENAKEALLGFISLVDVGDFNLILQAVQLYVSTTDDYKVYDLVSEKLIDASSTISLRLDGELKYLLSALIKGNVDADSSLERVKSLIARILELCANTVNRDNKHVKTLRKTLVGYVSACRDKRLWVYSDFFLGVLLSLPASSDDEIPTADLYCVRYVQFLSGYF